MKFFLLLNTKVDILKNAGNQTVDEPLTSIVFFLPTMEVNGVHQLSDYRHSSKYLPLCSAEFEDLRVSKR